MEKKIVKIVANVKKRSGLAGLADLVAEAGKALRVSCWLAASRWLTVWAGRNQRAGRGRRPASLPVST